MTDQWLSVECDEKHVTIRMAHYHAANLREALRAIQCFTSPLNVLNTGDWCGEIKNKLEPLKLNYAPNRTAKWCAEQAFYAAEKSG